MSRIDQFGFETILPQNIPDYLLKPTIEYLNLSVDSDNENPLAILDANCPQSMIKQSVTMLYLLYKNENEANEKIDFSSDAVIEIDTTELREAIALYLAMLITEFKSRQYIFQIEHPPLANLFDKGSTFKLKFPPDFLRVFLGSSPSEA